MSTRVISDRELVHNLRFEVAELRRGMAAIVERLEVVEQAHGVDSALASRRANVAPGDWFYPTFCRVCGHSFEAPTDHAPCPECETGDLGDLSVGPLTGVIAS